MSQLTSEMIEKRMQEHREWQESEDLRMTREIFEEVAAVLDQSREPRTRKCCHRHVQPR